MWGTSCSALSIQGIALCSWDVGQAFITETFEGHGNRIPGVSAQASPYSLLCELGHKGVPAWAVLLDWADLGCACFSNSENQNLCPRGQAGKARITFCQMIGSSFLKSNTGSSPGTQKLI